MTTMETLTARFKQCVSKGPFTRFTPFKRNRRPGLKLPGKTRTSPPPLVTARLKLAQQHYEAEYGEKSKGRMEQIEQGSGNVFADLGLTDAGERKTKLRLAYALNRLIEKEELSQPQLPGGWALPSRRCRLCSTTNCTVFPRSVLCSSSLHWIAT